MKVRDLIAKLQSVDPEAEVIMTENARDCFTIEPVVDVTSFAAPSEGEDGYYLREDGTIAWECDPIPEGAAPIAVMEFEMGDTHTQAEVAERKRVMKARRRVSDESAILDDLMAD